jgi:hypothetical protein
MSYNRSFFPSTLRPDPLNLGLLTNNAINVVPLLNADRNHTPHLLNLSEIHVDSSPRSLHLRPFRLGHVLNRRKASDLLAPGGEDESLTPG